MLVRPLFQATPKDLLPRPAPQRVKHRSYKELLGLDRPRKKIRMESDDDNDDFLERLLKEEAKEKQKKKNSIRRSYSPSSKQSGRRNKSRPQQQKNSNLNTNREGPSSRENESPYASRHLKSIQLKNQGKAGTLDRQNTSKNIGSRQADRNKPSNQNTIKIDNSDSMPLALSPSKQPHNRIRSQNALTLLKQQAHRRSRPQLTISHGLNPQAQEIVHRFSMGKLYKQHQYKPISYEKLLQMSEPRVSMQPKKPRLRQEKLFKDYAQQELLLRSIQALGRKGFTRATITSL